MSKKLRKASRIIAIILVMALCMGMSVSADDETEEDMEAVDTEQMSFSEDEGQLTDIDEFDQYVDGIYNVGKNARAAMSGVIRLGRSGTKLISNYSTVYTYSVDRIGVKNIKLQYKGSLGIWHTIITLDDRYYTNKATYMGSFSCSGVIGRTYRMKGTHYIINGSYTETRNNVTLELDF